VAVAQQWLVCPLDWPSGQAGSRIMVECPGCGLKLPDQKLEANARHNASGECWQLCGELAAYHLSRNDPTFIHQLAVDAYGAQHSGGVTRNITTAYALIGLYLVLEHEYTGRQVQRAHMLLAKKRITWPRLDPPESPGALTVQDVLQADPGHERDAMLMKWALSVWLAWEKAHEWVRKVSKDLLKIEQ
jgi:hypothetical protein